MHTLNINARSKMKTAKGISFLSLGSEAIPSKSMKSVIADKINKEITATVPGVWATLGMADDSDILWEGELVFSETGNDRSTGVTSEEVEIIKLLNHEELEKTDGKVLERFINFDNVDFKMKNRFSLDEIPKLRLTLFLNANEGATVFYELYDGTYEKVKSNDAEIEYILPEKTENFTTDRDRLTYIFDALPFHALKQAGKKFTLTDGGDKQSFVIKLLTFRRNNKGKQPPEIITRTLSKLLPEKEHRLLYYNTGTNAFIDTNGNTTFKINTSLKTLLLIHGTFSNTEKSFKGLTDVQANGRSWLQELIIESDYRQVLAFDHPTIVANAQMNTDAFVLLLNGASWSSANPVTLIATSRGGLVGKYMMTDPVIQNTIMPVQKAILIACGNGVHYFDTGRTVAKFFSLMRSALRIMGGGIFLPGIASFAQFSAEFFLSLPGSKQMTINDPSLTSLMTKKPVLQGTEIFPIVDDWDKNLTEDVRWLKKIASRGLDKLLTALIFKGRDHDWVVATENQAIMPASAKPAWRSSSMHTQVLHDKKSNPPIKEQVKKILLS